MAAEGLFSVKLLIGLLLGVLGLAADLVELQGLIEGFFHQLRPPCHRVLLQNGVFFLIANLQQGGGKGHNLVHIFPAQHIAPVSLHPLGPLKGLQHGGAHFLEPLFLLVRVQVVQIRPHAHLQAEAFPLHLNGIQIDPIGGMYQRPLIVNALHHSPDSDGVNVLRFNLSSLSLLL